MTFSIRKIIRACIAPKYQLSCSSKLWQQGLTELRHRGQGRRESGAFLLGQQYGQRRVITQFVFYDDLDPACLDTGIVIFNGAGYGPLWEECRSTRLSVVADIHTHPGLARQSSADQRHPMIATSGHIALIVPDFAQRLVSPNELGVYQYLGEHQWRNLSGPQANRFFYIGFWG
ncbi:MAG: hypothetical protein KDI79_12310 [Anaerolineae bacterium]|nr:hypothetical protein [Anaerolineae bacterium]